MDKKTTELEKLLSNLLIITEIDSTLRITNREDRVLLEELGNTPSDQAYYERLRKRVTTEREWYSEERLKQVDQFKQLFEWIDKSLRDARLVRKGEAEATIYIYGDHNGELLGFEFDVMET